MFLDFDLALNCGLIINQLVTISLKYAFSDGKLGEININFSKTSSHDYKLVVRDNGVGFSPEPDLKKIKLLGLKLVRRLVRQIDGEVEISNINGAKFKIIFPLNKYEFDK